MNKDEIAKTAKLLAAKGKGLLAADESFPTIKKRLTKIGVKSTKETRRVYRELLFSTKDIEKFISGVILFDETVYQSTKERVPFPKLLSSRGMIPGIKVDQGKEPFSASPDEMVTLGLDSLEERLKEYKKENLSFTKWRAVYLISQDLPTRGLIEENARRLSLFAQISQKTGFTPIVEPEVLRDGAHDISVCEEVTRKVLTGLFSELEKKKVFLGGLLLKTSMVTAGKDSQKKATPSSVTKATLRVLSKAVPEGVPGVVFLSGGQTPFEATANLNAINTEKDYPWELSFSFARALQNPALAAWKGKDANVKMAQGAFFRRARLISLARQGKYKKEMEED